MEGSTTVQRLVAWAEAEQEVRALFLVGSRGEADGRPDRLSDHDVLIFARDGARYESDEDWLVSFGSILVKLHAEYELLGTTVPTRLVQYLDGTRIDFSVCDVTLLERIAEGPKLPDMLDAGFRALNDKDGWASRLPKATGEAYRGRVPRETDYQAVVNEFWWEVTYVAKHLARGELLPALYSSECVIRFQCLVPMLEWHTRAVHGSDARIGPHGRGLTQVLDKEEWGRLQRTCLGASIEDAWKALFATTEYFREISHHVAEHFGFVADELALGVEELLRTMKGGRAGESQNSG